MFWKICVRLILCASRRPSHHTYSSKLFNDIMVNVVVYWVFSPDALMRGIIRPSDDHVDLTFVVLRVTDKSV